MQVAIIALDVRASNCLQINVLEVVRRWACRSASASPGFVRPQHRASSRAGSRLAWNARGARDGVPLAERIDADQRRR